MRVFLHQSSSRSENMPRGGSSSDAPLSAPIEVPYQELRQVKAELQRFDEQTQLDVKEFRHRIAEAERELSGAREV
eukprot:g32594.t1